MTAGQVSQVNFTCHGVDNNFLTNELKEFNLRSTRKICLGSALRCAREKMLPRGIIATLPAFVYSSPSHFSHTPFPPQPSRPLARAHLTHVRMSPPSSACSLRCTGRLGCRGGSHMTLTSRSQRTEKTARGPTQEARATFRPASRFFRCVPRQQRRAVAEGRSALRGSVSAASGSVIAGRR